MNSHISRRNLLRLAGAGVGGTWLAAVAGCGNGGGGGGGEAGGKISFWHYYGTPDTPVGKPLQDLFDAYMKAHPDVEIENRYVPFPEFNRTLLQSAAGQKLPDIALVNGFDTGTLAEAGILADLSDRVKTWGQQDQYIESVWATTQWKGKAYGVPHVADCYVLWYNKRLLGDAEPPKTWDDLGELAGKLKTSKRHGLAVCAGEGVEGATAWMIRFLAAGGSFPDVDSDAGRTALQQWVDLVSDKAMSRGVLGWSEEDVYNRFRTEQSAMMINSATYVNLLRKEAPKLEWGVALLPEDTKRATFLSEENLAITSGSKNADAAWDLVTYMQESKVLQKYLPERNKLPTRDDVASGPPWSDDDVWSVFVEQLPHRLGAGTEARVQVGRDPHAHPARGPVRGERRP